jgi:hypothetical protein
MELKNKRVVGLGAGMLLVLFVLGIFLPSRAFCQDQRSPREIVEEYCRLDAAGGRFDSRNPNFKIIGNLLVNPDEAGYDTSVIIRSFSVGNPVAGKTGVDVQVTYANVGLLAGGKLSKELGSEKATFHLSKLGKSWKIDGLRIDPHISKEWLLAEFERELRAEEKAGARNQDINANIALLRQW